MISHCLLGLSHSFTATIVYLSLSLMVWHPLPRCSLVFLLARSSYLSPLIFLFSIHSVCASFLSIAVCVRVEYALWCLVAIRPLVEEVIICLVKISSHYQSTFNQWTSTRLQIMFNSLYTWLTVSDLWYLHCYVVANCTTDNIS